MKVGDDQKIKEFIVPPPRESVHQKMKKSFDQVGKELFPQRPNHARMCRCLTCRDYNDEENVCSRVGCMQIPWNACRSSHCKRHHGQEKPSCEPIKELI